MIKKSINFLMAAVMMISAMSLTAFAEAAKPASQIVSAVQIEDDNPNVVHHELIVWDDGTSHEVTVTRGEDTVLEQHNSLARDPGGSGRYQSTFTYNVITKNSSGTAAASVFKDTVDYTWNTAYPGYSANTIHSVKTSVSQKGYMNTPTNAASGNTGSTTFTDTAGKSFKYIYDVTWGVLTSSRQHNPY